MSNTCLNGRTWCWFRLKNEICNSKRTGCNESFFLALCSLCLSFLWQVLMPTRLFFAFTKWWNCGWQTSFLETLDKFNLQKVCGEWQNWQWTQFFPKCLAFCVYSGFQEWSQNDQNEVPARRDLSLLNLLPTNLILRGTQRRFPPKYIENTF